MRQNEGLSNVRGNNGGKVYGTVTMQHHSIYSIKVSILLEGVYAPFMRSPSRVQPEQKKKGQYMNVRCFALPFLATRERVRAPAVGLLQRLPKAVT